MILISCFGRKKPTQDARQNAIDTAYGTRLYKSGFLNFADASKLDSLKFNLINSFDIYNDDNNKIAVIDAEELAECSFDFFLPNLNRILKKRGIALAVETANDFEKTHLISINGNRTELYKETDLNNDNFWDTASSNFFREVNRQLEAQKLDEQFYLLYGGNDLHVLLLTKEQYMIIADKYKGNTKEAPYLP